MAERQQWAETGLGAVVLIAAVGFLGYALAHAGGIGGGGYPLKARFGEVGSLAAGATVTVAGVKVGTVSSVELDPKTFLDSATLDIDPKVKLPSDSTVKITRVRLAQVSLAPRVLRRPCRAARLACAVPSRCWPALRP